jgi:hypothetical protein
LLRAGITLRRRIKNGSRRVDLLTARGKGTSSEKLVDGLEVGWWFVSDQRVDGADLVVGVLGALAEWLAAAQIDCLGGDDEFDRGGGVGEFKHF